MASDNADLPPSKKVFNKIISKIIKNLLKDKKNNESIASTESSSGLEISRKEMIKGILELSTKNAREIMIPRVDVLAVSIDTSLKSLIKIVDNAGHSRIPVYETTIDNIVGILYVKDMLKYIVEKPRKFELKKIIHKPYFVPETMTLNDLLVEFKRRKLHMAFVVDEYGGFGGIVTLEDILEEIVGEIKDEFDDDELPEIKKIGKNVYEIDSRMSLSNFNEETGINLPRDEFDTIGGFVFDQFGKIPKKNETIKYENISFKIKEIKGTRIMRIIVSISTP